MVKFKVALAKTGLWLLDHDIILRIVTGLGVVLAIALIVALFSAFDTFFVALGLLFLAGFFCFILGSLVWGVING